MLCCQAPCDTPSDFQGVHRLWSVVGIQLIWATLLASSKLHTGSMLCIMHYHALLYNQSRQFTISFDMRLQYLIGMGLLVP